MTSFCRAASVQSVSAKLKGPGAPKSSSHTCIAAICADAFNLLRSGQGLSPQSVTGHFYISAGEFLSPLGGALRNHIKYLYKYVFTNSVNKSMDNVKLTTFTILRVWFFGIRCIHTVVQPSSPSISRPFHLQNWNSVPVKFPRAWQSPFYLLSLWIWWFWISLMSVVIQYLSFTTGLFHFTSWPQGLSMV